MKVHLRKYILRMPDGFIADVLGLAVTMACFQNQQMVSAVPAAEQRATVAHGETVGKLPKPSKPQSGERTPLFCRNFITRPRKNV
jgi:hypothetical protein